MSDERQNKPGGTFWACIILAGLILYVASAGPMIWLADRGWLSGFSLDAAGWFYGPLDWLYGHGPEPIQTALDWYRDLWVR